MVEELLNKKYIDQKQMEAYKKVDPKLITPDLNNYEEKSIYTR